MVTITSDASGTLYAGSILTLTCTITLHQTLSSMLSDLSVTSTWVKSGSVLMSSTNSVISPAMLSGGTYSSTVVLNTTNTADAGNYFCRATVTPRDMSKTAFTTGGEASSQTEMIRVQSKDQRDFTGYSAGVDSKTLLQPLLFHLPQFQLLQYLWRPTPLVSPLSLPTTPSPSPALPLHQREWLLGRPLSGRGGLGHILLVYQRLQTMVTRSG